MTNLGFVGLGVMGSRIAQRLLEAGHHVTGWNRTRAKAEWLTERGLRWADSPRDVATVADVTFTMVTDTRALHDVTGGERGLLAGLGEGKVYIDMSTVSPAASRELAVRVREADARMLDTPVSGSVAMLEEGRLSLMVGGDPDVFERVGPILRDVGPTVTHVGPNGHGALMKIATNLGLAVQMLAFSEAVLLAEKGGIARETAVHVLTHSAIASPMVRYRGPFVLRQPAEAWFDVGMMQKDLRLALEAALEYGVPLPTTAATNEFLTAARSMGLAHHDFAIVFDVLAALAGVDVRGDGGEL
ncbi:MAG TPA: NAD(P)-dependent oxidoreductase [Terriglobales bacterium]|nr:NAD(P)-dependent oxidoreductase [Terriglobales bacterium]